MPIATALEKFFLKNSEIKNQKSYAVAVSGGPDSMAMLFALLDWAQKNDKLLHVLTVDHGLRIEAKAEAEQVANWITEQSSNALKHQTLIWEGDKPETGLMEAARSSRYALMANYCQAHDIKTLFVAHHQDDQAETFLIRLSKGSGLDGLASMNEVQNYNDSLTLARPFLELSKKDLLDYCAAEKIKYANDPSNKNEDYLRPRLRQSMSILEKEGLSAKRLVSLTKRLARARKALEKISDDCYAQCLKKNDSSSLMLDFTSLKSQPEEIAFRVLQYAVKDLRGASDYGVRMDRLESLFESLWYNAEDFKPRTLGGLIFALKDKNQVLYIEKE